MEKYKEALERSGYLMESRIIRKLNQMGCFVDPNQCIKDKITGKSREVDIIAEFFERDFEVEDKIAVKTKFIIETINNLHPFVLITERGWSPNSGWQDYIRFFTTPSNDTNPFLDKIDIAGTKGVDHNLIYSQYCSFTGKKGKGELMAHHTEDIHSSLEKLVTYVDGEEVGWADHSDEYWRLFFFQPILVLSRDLLKVKNNDTGTIDLVSASRGHLEYNYYRDERPTSILVDIVVESELEKYVTEKTTEDLTLQNEMKKIRRGLKDDDENFAAIIKRVPPHK